MEILINSLIISLFCVGLRLVTEDGMILDFIRKPYEMLSKAVYRQERFVKLIYIRRNKNPLIDLRYANSVDWKRYFNKKIIYLLKPIIGCVTCMSSVWSVVISHFFLNGIEKQTLLIIFVVACLNTWIYKLIDKT